MKTAEAQSTFKTYAMKIETRLDSIFRWEVVLYLCGCVDCGWNAAPPRTHHFRDHVHSWNQIDLYKMLCRAGEPVHIANRGNSVCVYGQSTGHRYPGQSMPSKRNQCQRMNGQHTSVSIVQRRGDCKLLRFCTRGATSPATDTVPGYCRTRREHPQATYLRKLHFIRRLKVAHRILVTHVQL